MPLYPAVNLSVFNILDRGADPTGARDSSAAIIAAIAAADLAGGGIIFCPPGTYLTSTITLKNHMWLCGAGMRATIIKLKAGTNSHVIQNFVSPDGIQANAEYCGVLDLMIDGNKANQSSTSHGVYFSSYPVATQATNDDSFDTHQLIQNVFMFNVHDDGFRADSRSGMQLYNVQIYYAGNDGFVPSHDTELVGCIAGHAGRYGFKLSADSIRLNNCKAFYSGEVNASLGYGFYLSGGANGISLAACEAQDNKATGFTLDTLDRCALFGCVADSNGTSSAGTFPALDFWATTNSLVEGFVAYERKANGSTSYQTQALRMRQSSAGNRISLTHSAANGATIAAPIMSSSTALAGNDLRINAGQAIQTVTYAATITPNPYTGNIIKITLTGNITINAPSVGHPGMTLTFIFTQDGTGGRTTTFNAVFKTNWTPNTTANMTNTIVFTYDGTNWWQVSSSVNL